MCFIRSEIVCFCEISFILNWTHIDTKNGFISPFSKIYIQRQSTNEILESTNSCRVEQSQDKKSAKILNAILFIHHNPGRTANWPYHRRKIFSLCEIPLSIYLIRNVSPLNSRSRVTIFPLYRNEKKIWVHAVRSIVLSFYIIRSISSMYEFYSIWSSVKE